VGNRRGGHLAQFGQCRPGVAVGAAGVDGHDSRAGFDECEVGEVEALGEVDAGCGLAEPWRREPGSVAGGQRPVRGQHRHVIGLVRVSGQLQGCRRVLAAACRAVCLGQGVAGGAEEPGWELILDGDHELQVGYRRVYPARETGQRRQCQAAQVVRKAGLTFDGAVECGQGHIEVVARPGQEEPGEGFVQGPVGLGLGPFEEVAVPLIVTARRGQQARQRENGLTVGLRPAHRVHERLNLQMPAGLACPHGLCTGGGIRCHRVPLTRSAWCACWAAGISATACWKPPV